MAHEAPLVLSGDKVPRRRESLRRVMEGHSVRRGPEDRAILKREGTRPGRDGEQGRRGSGRRGRADREGQGENL